MAFRPLCTTTIQVNAKNESGSTTNQSQYHISIAFPSPWQVTPDVYGVEVAMFWHFLDLRLSSEVVVYSGRKGVQKGMAASLKVAYKNAHSPC
jgi:hypothetical protein